MTETLKPATAAQVLDALAWAAAEEAPVEIAGTGTKRGLGRPLGAGNRVPGHRLDLSGLTGITLYEPEELVLSARAGTTLAEIEAAVAAKGQMLAFEPPALAGLYGGEGGTLGGLVACNLAGPRRLRIGAARDHVLGFEAVGGRGAAFRSGGRVVKNVTGYDLSKLMTGSHGTLAALTDITVKVLPAPETQATLMLAGLDAAAAMRAMAAAMGSSHEVSGAAHLPAGVGVGTVPGAGAEAVTALRLEGFAPSVAARVEALSGALAGFGAVAVLEREASAALWAAVRDVAPFRPAAGAASGAADAPLWRISLTPSEGAATVAEIARAVPGRAFYDWAGGLVWYAVDGPQGAPVQATAEAPSGPAAAGARATRGPRAGHVRATWEGADSGSDARSDAGAAAIRAALAAHGGGHATLVRGPDSLRSRVPVFQPQPAALAALSRRVKDSFDPLRILNPGRMYEGV